MQEKKKRWKRRDSNDQGSIWQKKTNGGKGGRKVIEVRRFPVNEGVVKGLGP